MKEEITSNYVEIENFYSAEGKSREMAGLRKLVTSFAGQPGIIGLHGGLPPASSFPIKSMSLTLGDGQTLVIDDPAKLAAAQQYCLVTAGYAPLHAWVKRHMACMHTVPAGHDIIMTSGNNQTIEVVFRLLLNIGDAVLCEEYTYPHIAESLVTPQGFVAVPLAMDGHGIVPSLFRRTLEGMRAAGQKLPRLLYTVPVGQNPTGAVTPVKRRREIYVICREYNILLLEDDPYYYLQWPPAAGHGSTAEAAPRGLANLGTSYLSMDTDGRVIRLDSFSKVLAPGMRVGWVTAPRPLLEKIIYHAQGVQLGANSFTQVVIADILEAWGDKGFEAHVTNMQREYCRRAAIIQAAAEEHLSGLAEWQAPSAGMFLWLRLLGVRDADDVLGELKAASVVVVPGRFSHCCGPRHEDVCPYVRASFACATPAELREGMARLGTVLRAHAAKEDSPRGLPANGSSSASRDVNGCNGAAGADAAHIMSHVVPADGVPASVFAGDAASAGSTGSCAAAGLKQGRRAGLGRQEDSAMCHGMAGIGLNGSDAQQQQRLPAEVMPGCRAKVALVNGSPGLSSDALAPLPAKTMAHVASGHLGA